MSDDIKVEFLSHARIEKIANGVLTRYNLAEAYPIDVDKFVDNDLKINIIPFPNLYRDFEINAITSSDLKKIFVDDYLYLNLDLQYRFTLAHEVGHIFLHKNIYDKAEINGLNSYREFMGSISEEEYESLEYQANCFAGYFLVPTTQLINQFQRHLKKMSGLIQRRFRNQKREFYIEIMTGLMAREICSFFNVHYRVVEVRLKREHLINQIP